MNSYCHCIYNILILNINTGGRTRTHTHNSIQTTLNLRSAFAQSFEMLTKHLKYIHRANVVKTNRLYLTSFELNKLTTRPANIGFIYKNISYY